MPQESISIPESLAATADMTLQALPPGAVGAVVGRAGVGKTALIVQLALHAMLREHNALHVNLTETVQKTALWYNEICSRLSETFPEPRGVFPWERYFPRRLIMTLKVSGFSAAGLRERIQDLREQDVFSPHLLVVDGLSFDISQRETVEQLKLLSRDLAVRTWITVGSHREEGRDEFDRPVRIAEVADLIDVAWELVPEPADGRIYLKHLASGNNPRPAAGRMFLEPSSMLLNCV